CHKPQQPIITKETPVSALRWLQIKSNLPDSLLFKIIRTTSIEGIILLKTEGLANLTDMMSKFMSSNMALSSGSGALPGPTIPAPSNVVKQGTEVTKDQVQTLSSQSTAHVQPLVTQSETLVSEPIAAPVSASMPNLKPSIPYPSRRDNERRREQANEQIEKFYEIFKDMSFEISFTDALILMPKFASTLKALIGNKEKLSEMARTPMNEHFSMVILNKFTKNLETPANFSFLVNSREWMSALH
nr:reverse transcriptase domain-containing protein [Tanacetum cinerariifolium]